MTTTPAGQAAPATHTVTITVNDKPVNVQGPRVTGLQIKQAAIDQGVPNIQLNFVLMEQVGPHKTKVIGDNETITVNPHSKFVAIANDDNS